MTVVFLEMGGELRKGGEMVVLESTLNTLMDQGYRLTAFMFSRATYFSELLPG